MKRRKFLTVLSSLPFLGFLKPAEPIPLHPTAWKPMYGYMEVKSDPRLTDPNDYYILKPGNEIPTTLIVKPEDEERARALIDSEYFKESVQKAKESKSGLLTKREKLAQVDPYWYLYER